jgi:hypothetical protein
MLSGETSNCQLFFFLVRRFLLGGSLFSSVKTETPIV